MHALLNACSYFILLSTDAGISLFVSISVIKDPNAKASSHWRFLWTQWAERHRHDWL